MMYIDLKEEIKTAMLNLEDAETPEDVLYYVGWCDALDMLIYNATGRTDAEYESLTDDMKYLIESKLNEFKAVGKWYSGEKEAI